ncbi:MAG TPA: tRNA 4-thiouridine(8) synthase ThiI [Clostridiales bacterium]|nr:tRNA 4-thiouridine(8) synthase ThiI [Clostridiales bacterium]
MRELIMVRYGEIYLKGRNRPYFLRLLVRRVTEAARPFGAKVWLHDSRIMVSDMSDINACMDRIRRVFGVHSVCPAVEMPKDDFEAVRHQAAAMMQGKIGTFKVVARRADKQYPLDSPAINAQIGGYVLEHVPGLSVDVKNPEHELSVEIRDWAYLYVTVLPGAGGMPVGSNGKAALLLSGGIDSPVAGYLIAKRGVEMVAIHFYSFPYTGERAKQKVLTLASILADYCCGMRVYVVPFTEIQMAIHEKCPDDHTTLIMRRFMMRIADIIADREGAQALVTGESIGQVASQTMQALVCTDQVVSRLVFRPLIGFDKIEITRWAEQIGTYETSCLPYEDCCTVFTPKHPVTQPKPDRVLKAEVALIDAEDMIARAVAGCEIVNL